MGAKEVFICDGFPGEGELWLVFMRMDGMVVVVVYMVVLVNLRFVTVVVVVAGLF